MAAATVQVAMTVAKCRRGRFEAVRAGVAMVTAPESEAPASGAVCRRVTGACLGGTVETRIQQGQAHEPRYNYRQYSVHVLFQFLMIVSCFDSESLAVQVELMVCFVAVRM